DPVYHLPYLNPNKALSTLQPQQREPVRHQGCCEGCDQRGSTRPKMVGRSAKQNDRQQELQSLRPIQNARDLLRRQRPAAQEEPNRNEQREKHADEHARQSGNGPFSPTQQKPYDSATHAYRELQEQKPPD